MEELSIEEQAAAARSFTERLVVEAMGFRASVTARVDEDDHVRVAVDGDDLGLLVGPRAATLQALEELVRAFVQRSTGGHSARVFLDVAGYRERRRAALAEFTRSIADEVLAAGEARELEPMGAPDRKVVHDVVAELDGVTTTSEGEEPRRRVVIRPE